MTTMSSASARPVSSPRRHHGGVALLLVLATLAALVGSVALWIDRQALDTEQWTQTSSRLIANREIRDAVGSYAVAQLFATANVAAALRDVLPSALAGPSEAELRRLAQGLTAEVIGTRAAQKTWSAANRQAQSQLLHILEQSGSQTQSDQAVILNLRPLLEDIVQALLGSDIVRALPGGGQQIFGLGSESAGQLVVLRSDQVRKARGFVQTVRGLSVVLPVAAILLFAAAVGLARGWRRLALGWVGLCLAGVGVLVLVGRRVLAPIIANALLSESSYRPAGRAAWMIATSQLRDTAVATLILGAVVVAVAVVARLAGPVARRA